MTLLMGAVAYDPKVVTIWSGFRAWLVRQGLPYDFVLYSNYERQAEDLVAGRIHAAWHSPLAWIRSRRMAEALGRTVRPLVMRDTDRDLRSVVVVRADSGIQTVDDLAGRVVACGAIDSPQATLLPLDHLRQAGVKVDVRRFDIGVGLHGDHIGGEREAARLLMSGEAAAACMIDANHLLFGREGTLPAGSTRILTATEPYDHCVMAVSDTAPEEHVRHFGELLLGMSYADPEVRPLLDLEGLTAWHKGRTSGYGALEAAVSGFYNGQGGLVAEDYQP